MLYPEGLPLYTIWDDIAYLLDSTKDLLSLALTCRAFKELIIPDHLEYRYICCDIRRLDAWKLLASRPRLARGIRFVKLEYESRDAARLPRSLRNDVSVPDTTVSTDEYMAFFKNSLSYMTCLKKFCWVQEYDSPEHLIDVSRVLTCTTNNCLDALSVELASINDGMDNQLQLETLSIWNLTGLKQVVLYKPPSAGIQMILHTCPNLEELSLWSFPPAIVPDLFQNAHWKKLRQLLIQSFTRDEPNNIAISATITPFLDRHDNLETLFVEMPDVPAPSFPASRLPRLRSLAWNSYIPDSAVTSFLSGDILSHLVHWQCPLDSIAVTLPQMNKLASLDLSLFVRAELRIEPETYFFPLLLKAPNLEKLCLRVGDLDFWGQMLDGVRDTRQERFIVAFMNNPKLTHLFCDLTVPEAYRNPKDLHGGLQSLCKRLSALPALRYFRLNIGSEAMIVKIERDDDGSYSDYQFVTLKEGGGGPTYWGNFFFDIYM